MWAAIVTLTYEGESNLEPCDDFLWVGRPNHLPVDKEKQ
jgi:hypothetical protein